MLKRVSELEGAQLDWMVAKCEGGSDLAQGHDWHNKPWFFFVRDDEDPERVDRVYLSEYEPSTDWTLGGPITEREGVSMACRPKDARGLWCAVLGPNRFLSPDYEGFGPTPLIAAMRCYVASKLGDTLDVPDELN